MKKKIKEKNSKTWVDLGSSRMLSLLKERKRREEISFYFIPTNAKHFHVFYILMITLCGCFYNPHITYGNNIRLSLKC